MEESGKIPPELAPTSEYATTLGECSNDGF